MSYTAQFITVNFMDKLSIITQSCHIHVDLKRDGGVWKFILL